MIQVKELRENLRNAPENSYSPAFARLTPGAQYLYRRVITPLLLDNDVTIADLDFSMFKSVDIGALYNYLSAADIRDRNSVIHFCACLERVPAEITASVFL